MTRVNPLRSGVFLAPLATEISRLRENVHEAEAAGFDHVAIQDHPYVPDFLDTFALIGTLIGETSRIGFLPNVANIPLRPAAILAKTAASLDLLSGGRFELGLGGGARWSEIVGLGGARLAPGQAYASVAEAIDVMRALWEPGRVADVDGQHHRLSGAATGPVPAHGIGIWLGASGPRMLDLLGRSADAWIAPIATPFETKPAAQDRIDAAARSAGREPTDVRRVIQLIGTITDRPSTAERPHNGPGTRPIRTTPDDWAAVLAEFVHDERFDTVNFLPEEPSPEQVRRFATEVIPAVRAAVDD